MTALYNENDPKAAAWLRELIKKGVIADGEVNEQSIEDLRPSDLAGFTQVHFFAGIGGWSYALRLAGVPDDFPVWTGSCPCQPFSAAGKGAGFADDRHLWPAWFWLIKKQWPGLVFGEQVARGAGYDWLDLVSNDLEGEAYSVAAVNLSAASQGFPHQRERLFWMAQTSYRYGNGRERIRPLAPGTRPEFEGLVQSALSGQTPTGKYSLRDDGIPNALAILRGFGNAIVPQVAQAFITAALSV